MCQHCQKSEENNRCVCELQTPIKIVWLAQIEADELQAAKDWLNPSADYRNLNKELYRTFNAQFNKEFENDRRKES